MNTIKGIAQCAAGARDEVAVISGVLMLRWGALRAFIRGSFSSRWR